MPTPAELLERSQWDLFWLPPDARVLSRPDLLAVTCDRPVMYLNAVLKARGEPARAIDVVEALPARRPPRWMVTDTWDAAPLERALADRGYAPDHGCDVRMFAVDAWRRSPALETRAVADLATLRDCVRAAAEAFGGQDHSTDESLSIDLRACKEGGRVHRFVAYDAGRAVASGGLTAFPDLGFGLLWAGGVVPDARGRGAYLSVLAARVERARQLGLRWVGLYAMTTTSSPIVERLGFERHGGMAFWEKAR